MKNIAVLVNETKDTEYKYTKSVIDFLEGKDCICYTDNKVNVALNTNYPVITRDNIDRCFFVLVIGGDGTILRAIRRFPCTDVPFIGINKGRMGFLASINLNEYKQDLSEILDGKFSVGERMKVELSDGEKSYGSGLNEVMFKQKIGLGVGEFKVYVNDVLLAHYTADGVLVSTPTGSTAYALSAGGPIINSDCENILIQPVCPHSLHSRSIVISAQEEVKITYNKNDSIVFLDGIRVDTEKEMLTIRKSSETTKFIYLEDYNFYNMLFDKIKEPNYTRGGLS